MESRLIHEGILQAVVFANIRQDECIFEADYCSSQGNTQFSMEVHTDFYFLF